MECLRCKFDSFKAENGVKESFVSDFRSKENSNFRKQSTCVISRISKINFIATISNQKPMTIYSNILINELYKGRVNY